MEEHFTVVYRVLWQEEKRWNSFSNSNEDDDNNLLGFCGDRLLGLHWGHMEELIDGLVGQAVIC